MTTSPTQLLLLLLLGLFSVAVLLGALYLLYRAARSRSVVVRQTVSAEAGAQGTDARGATLVRRSSIEPDNKRQFLRWAVPVAMLLWVFGGKYLVAPFFKGNGDAPAAQQPTTSQLRGASGAQLAISRHGAPDGPTLVLTHGWGADRRDWAYLLSALPPEFNVVTWDLPGLGQSSEPGGRDYSMAKLAADLDSVVEHASAGGKPVTLVGHSIGGILNLEYARLHPEKLGREVRSIVQVNTTYTNPLKTKKNAQASLKMQEPLLEPMMHVVSAASPVFRALGWFAYQSGLAHMQLATQSFAGSQTWGQLDNMARYAYRSSPGVIARGVLGMVDWDGSDVLPTINVPTLIISGNEDVTTLPVASDRMEQDIPSASRVSVAQAAHLGPVEQYERYADAIASFAKPLPAKQ